MSLGRTTKLVIALAVTLGASSCGSKDTTAVTGAGGFNATGGNGSSAGQGQTISLSHVWTAPGDAETLQALLDVHSARHPADSVSVKASNMFASADAGTSTDVTMVFAALLPDLSTLRPLDDFLASPSQADAVSNIPPEFFASANGATYAIPAKVSRLNTLYYNKYVLKAQNLSPPTTIAELRTACQTLKTAGVICLASAFSNLLVESILAAGMGIDAFANFRRGMRDETALRSGIDLVAEVVDNYADLSFTAQSPMFDEFMRGNIAMVIDGSFSMGPLKQLGQTAGVDFGVKVPPGNAGLFIYNADGLAITAGTPNLQGAMNLLDSALSVDGVTAMSTFSNQVPVRKDVVLPNADSEQRGLAQDMIEAKYRVLSGSFGWFSAIAAFLQSTPHDKEALLKTLVAAP